MIVTFEILTFIKNLKLKGILVAIDYGLKNIGVAISDEKISYAVPLLTIISNNVDVQISKICNLLSQYNAKGVVMGWPIQLNGNTSIQTKKVECFSKILADKIDIPILFQDERMTSKTAHGLLKYYGISKTRSSMDHQIAAMIILEAVISQLCSNDLEVQVTDQC